MRQIICALVCLCVCLSFCSCGLFVWRGAGHEPEVPLMPDPDIPSADTQPAVDITPDFSALDALPEADFSGATVVLTASNAGDYASDGEDLFDAACAARTAAVEEKYSVGVAVTERTPGQIYEELSAAAKRGEYYSDLISIPMSWFARFAEDGLLAPLSGNEAIDLSAPYYGSTDAFTYRGAVYGTAGAANAIAGYAYCVYFNRRLASEAGLDLYAEAASDDWTWTHFDALLSGRFGTGYACASETELINCIMTGSGVIYTTLRDGVRICDYTGDRADAAMACAASILHGGAACESDYAAGAFAAGECLFYIGTLAEASILADMTDSFGILPLPSGQTGDSCVSYVSMDMPVLCIPVGACAGEHARAIYQALQAASASVIPAAYLSNLTAYALRDNASALFARTVRDGMRCDFAYVFGAPFDAVANCTYWAVQSAVSNGRDHAMLYRNYLGAFEDFVQ